MSPGSGIRIEPCEPADAVELAEIGRETFLETYADSTSPEDMSEFLRTAYTLRTVRTALEAEGSQAFLARCGGETVAYLHLRFGEAQVESLGGKGLEIASVYVRKSHKGKGIGSALLACAIDRARAIGADHVWLGVWERNPDAIAFYRSKGFVEAGEHPFEFGGEVHRDLLMRLDL